MVRSAHADGGARENAKERRVEESASGSGRQRTRTDCGDGTKEAGTEKHKWKQAGSEDSNSML
eukprot:3025795-Rhodomonas_salina.1